MTVKQRIRSLLINDTALTSLLKGSRVYALKAPNAEEFPRITFFEVSGSDANSADDRPYAQRTTIQIDIWVKAGRGNPDEITKEVKRIMTDAGYPRIGGGEFYEDSAQVLHVALRYLILEGV